MTWNAKQYWTVLVVLLVVALGAAAVVAGEADDSPGLQGIGVLVAAAALWRGWVVLRR